MYAFMEQKSKIVNKKKKKRKRFRFVLNWLTVNITTFTTILSTTVQ